jgi:hypothetical protein
MKAIMFSLAASATVAVCAVSAPASAQSWGGDYGARWSDGQRYL